MNHSVLDQNLQHPIADICKVNDDILVLSYDRTIRLYKNNKEHTCITAACPLTKACVFKEWIVAVSYMTGYLYVYNKNIELKDVLIGFQKGCVLHAFQDSLIVGTLNNELYILQEHTSGSLKVQHSIKCEKTPTAIVSNGSNVLCIGFQNLLKIFNNRLEEIYNKSYPECITTLQCIDSLIIIGFLSGKVQVENTRDEYESFMFNAHLVNAEDVKICYPVTQIEAVDKKKIITSGYEGKVIKWDIENKKIVKTELNVGYPIRKFITTSKFIYLLIETEQSTNRLYTAEIQFDN